MEVWLISEVGVISWIQQGLADASSCVRSGGVADATARMSCSSVCSSHRNALSPIAEESTLRQRNSRSCQEGGSVVWEASSNKHQHQHPHLAETNNRLLGTIAVAVVVLAVLVSASRPVLIATSRPVLVSTSRSVLVSTSQPVSVSTSRPVLEALGNSSVRVLQRCE